MTVYVDELKEYPIEQIKSYARKHGTRWCHMSADTPEELDEAASWLGLWQAWEQSGHYDLTPYKRQRAIKYGAKVVTSREMAVIRRRLESAQSRV